MTPGSPTLSDGVHGAIGGYNVVMLSAIGIALVVAAVLWFRRR
jgi:hypothetical protein